MKETVNAPLFCLPAVANNGGKSCFLSMAERDREKKEREGRELGRERDGKER